MHKSNTRFVLILAFFLSVLLCASHISANRWLPRSRLRGLQPVSKQFTPEAVHSFSPGDLNQVYYNLGGHSVLSNHGIRLVPAVAARSGWLWNEYALESVNFELELKFEIHSKPHFGGEGMAIWFIQGNSDPSFYTDPLAINGPVMGMNDDFKGVGVIIDTYDNDNRRNNPSIFAVQNTQGKFSFRNDLDYEGSMITDMYRGSYRCVNDLRNTNRPVEMVIKVLHGVLFVYINSHISSGYRSCLAVQLNLGVDEHGKPRTLYGNHLAITGQTGQVSDSIDIYEINMRYLPSSENLDEELQEALTQSSSFDLLSVIVIIVLLGIAGWLAHMTFQDLTTYSNMLNNHIDSVIIATKLNESLAVQVYVSIILFILTICTFRWLLALILLVPMFIRLQLRFKKAMTVSPSMIPQVSSYRQGATYGAHTILGMSLAVRYRVFLIAFVLVSFFLVLELFFGFDLFQSLFG